MIWLNKKWINCLYKGIDNIEIINNSYNKIKYSIMPIKIQLSTKIINNNPLIVYIYSIFIGNHYVSLNLSSKTKIYNLEYENNKNKIKEIR